MFDFCELNVCVFINSNEFKSLAGPRKEGHVKPVQHSHRVLYQFLINPNIVERNPKVVRPGFVLSLSEILSLGFQGGSMFVYQVGPSLRTGRTHGF